eukprot:319786_1
MATPSLCKTTCAAIARYYKSLGHSYDNIFSEFCADNAFDDDDVLRDEMDIGADYCLLVEFDDNFPFKKEPKDDEAKLHFIFDLITKCMANPQISFDHDYEQSYVPDWQSYVPDCMLILSPSLYRFIHMFVQFI